MVDAAPRAPAPLSTQNKADIGGMLPGLTIRSMVVGGASEDKVSVRRGFRGCMQVRGGGGGRWGGLPLTGSSEAGSTIGDSVGQPVSFQRVKNLSDRHPRFNSSCFLFRPILSCGSPRHPGRPWPPQLPTAMPATCPSAFVKCPESSPSPPPPPSPTTDVTQVGPVPVPWSQGFQLRPKELL